MYEEGNYYHEQPERGPTTDPTNEMIGWVGCGLLFLCTIAAFALCIGALFYL